MYHCDILFEAKLSYFRHNVNFDQHYLFSKESKTMLTKLQVVSSWFIIQSLEEYKLHLLSKKFKKGRAIREATENTFL